MMEIKVKMKMTLKLKSKYKSKSKYNRDNMAITRDIHKIKLIQKYMKINIK